MKLKVQTSIRNFRLPIISNMNELCRLCGQKNKNGKNIFDESTEKPQIAIKIHQILGIEVSKEDVLPTCVCLTCRDFLDNVASFVDSCRKVQEDLKVLHKNFTRQDHELVDGGYIDSSNTSKIECLLDDTSSSVLDLESDGTSTSKYDANVNVTDKPCNLKSSVDLSRAKSRKSKRISKIVEYFSDSDHAVDVDSKKRVTRSSNSSYSLPVHVQVDKTELSDDDGNDDAISDDSDSDYVYKPSTKKLKVSSPENDSKPTKSSLPKVKPVEPAEKMTCSFCKQEFNHEFALAEHVNLHTGNRPFKCRLCDKTFRIRKELNSHLRTIHSEKEYRCPSCNYVCRYKGKLTEHMKNSHERPFACAICGHRTGLKCKLAEHIASRHKEFAIPVKNWTPFVCEICGTSLKTKKSLYSHRINMHFPEPKQCQTCGVMFPSYIRYKSHMLTCGKVRKRYPCNECDRTYANKASLNDHKNSHLDLRPYKCDICDKAFRTRTHLDSHKFCHRGPSFHCEICGQPFNRKDNLNGHVRRHYTNPDPNLMVIAN